MRELTTAWRMAVFGTRLPACSWRAECSDVPRSPDSTAGTHRASHAHRRPCACYATVLGVLVAQGDLFCLHSSTDMADDPLEELEFNLLWHHALRLEMEEAHTCPEDAETTSVSLCTMEQATGQHIDHFM